MNDERKKMTQEQYTVTSNKNGADKLCPFCFGGPDPYGELRCSGERCMAFVRELDANGNSTDRGRCGMVRQNINQAIRGDKE